jgi:hypothetical protein
MTLRDPELRQYCEGVTAMLKDRPQEHRSLVALLDAIHLFRTLEGSDSPGVAEAMEHLCRPISGQLCDNGIKSVESATSSTN